MKRTKLLLLLAAVWCLSAAPVKSQDIHFSQMYNTPLNLNPALTGNFDGVVRASNNYRSQWSSLGKGYKTLQLSVDAPLNKERGSNRYFGGGLFIYQDKAGSAQFTQTAALASLSYTMAMDDALSHWVSIGFQTGIRQWSFDFSSATWDEQWNGDSYDPSIPTTEVIQLPTFSYVDFNAGLNYRYAADEFNSVDAGISMHHIGSPNATFFTNEDNALLNRITIHGSGDFSLNDERVTFVNPRLLVQFQGKEKTMVFGGYLRNKLRLRSIYTDFQKEIFFDWGMFYRLNESIIASTRVQYHSFGLGLSYDFGVGALGKMTSANSWEIALNYVMPVPRGQRARYGSRIPRFL